MLAGFALFSLFHPLQKACSKICSPDNSKRISIAIISLLFTVSLIVPMEYVYLLELDKTQPSGVEQIWFYIRNHIPVGTKIASDVDWRWTGKWMYDVKEDVWRPDYIPPRPHHYRTPSDLAHDGYQYIVVEGFNRLTFQAQPEKFPIESHFYTELRKHAPMLLATKMHRVCLLGTMDFNRFSSYEIYDLRKLAHGVVDPHEQLNPPDPP